LLLQTMRLPCSFALIRAGINIAINKATMEMTTKSSMSVNPVSPKDSFRRKLRCRFRTSVWFPAKRGPSPCLSGNLPLLRLVILVSNGLKPLIIRMAAYSLQSVYTGISRITMHIPAQLSRYIGTKPDIQ